MKTWSKLQTVVARSSAEAELYAACKAGSEALGTQSYMKDLGLERGARLHLDSTGALSLINKTGLSAVKHIEVQHLWLQQVHRDRRISCVKVHTDHNAADLMTKPLNAERISYLMGICGYRYM